MCNK